MPLNYSLVDQRDFFKRYDNCDIDDVLTTLRDFEKTEWPYFGDELPVNQYVVGNQPLTHVQVRYKICGKVILF